MKRFVSRYLGFLLWSSLMLAATVGLIVHVACTFRIEPIVEVNDASVQIGPIYVCYDAGG